MKDFQIQSQNNLNLSHHGVGVSLSHFLNLPGSPKVFCWLDFALVWLNNSFDVRQMSKTIGRKGMCQRPEKMIKLGDVQQADTSCDQAKKKDVHLIDSSLGRYWF